MTTQLRCAVLGAPITHSLSPVLHRAAYAHLGLDWRYDAFEVDEAALPDFVAGLDGSWRGLSLTMPLKRAVLHLLDDVSDVARAVDAVNTVLRTDDGRLHGHNTDVPGLVAALREKDVDDVRRAAVLGGGATARAAVAALAEVADEVEVFVRTASRADEMALLAERCGVRCTTRSWADLADGLRADLVVATTPAGVLDAAASSIPEKPGVLLDVLYEPWPTALAAGWDRAGGVVLGGLDLLVHQAVLQVELMTGRPVPAQVLREAGDAALAGRARGRPST